VDEKVAAVRDRTVELANAAIPKVAETARQTGQSLAKFAGAAGDTILATLKSEQLIDLAQLGLSLSAARIAGRQAVRFAVRRPVLVAIGGIAVAQLGLAIYRRMNEKAA
jgi:hypothetical protein